METNTNAPIIRDSGNIIIDNCVANALIINKIIPITNNALLIERAIFNPPLRHHPSDIYLCNHFLISVRFE